MIQRRIVLAQISWQGHSGDVHKSLLYEIPKQQSKYSMSNSFDQTLVMLLEYHFNPLVLMEEVEIDFSVVQLFGEQQPFQDVQRSVIGVQHVLLDAQTQIAHGLVGWKELAKIVGKSELLVAVNILLTEIRKKFAGHMFVECIGSELQYVMR